MPLMPFTQTTAEESLQMDLHDAYMAMITQPTANVKWLGSDEVTQIIRKANERKSESNVVSFPVPARGL